MKKSACGSVEPIADLCLTHICERPAEVQERREQWSGADHPLFATLGRPGRFRSRARHDCDSDLAIVLLVRDVPPGPIVLRLVHPRRDGFVPRDDVPMVNVDVQRRGAGRVILVWVREGYRRGRERDGQVMASKLSGSER
jgi:hypothetical protein